MKKTLSAIVIVFIMALSSIIPAFAGPGAGGFPPTIPRPPGHGVPTIQPICIEGIGNIAFDVHVPLQ